jgi:hypothetical protein
MIFSSAKAKTFRKHLRKHDQKGTSYKGASRRATGLLPTPMKVEDVLLKDVSINGYSNLLLSLEAKQQSGCLIIQSKKNKSRSGILIFRGRILGCMHGHKNMDNYSFGDIAYMRALSDLQNFNKTVDVYNVREDIVLAASALFHGTTQEGENMPAADFLENTIVGLMESNMPGCIVMTDRTDITTCVIYMFAGKIAAIHSSQGGWLEPDFNAIEKQIKILKSPRVQSCYMPCNNMVDVNQYSFSLSGLADRDFSRMPETGNYYVPNIFYMLRLDEARLAGLAPDAVRINKFLPQVGRYELSFLNRLSSLSKVHSFSTAPR